MLTQEIFLIKHNITDGSNRGGNWGGKLPGARNVGKTSEAAEQSLRPEETVYPLRAFVIAPKVIQPYG